MNHFAAPILWVYIVLLVVGGLFGYLKAGSKVSLVTSSISAAILVLCALDIVFKAYMAGIVMAVLLVVFAIRLGKTKKFMPSGLMLVLTALALVSRYLKF
jgi:uncharacterized membrane protein (UPF0136 family)